MVAIIINMTTYFPDVASYGNSPRTCAIGEKKKSLASFFQ